MIPHIHLQLDHIFLTNKRHKFPAVSSPASNRFIKLYIARDINHILNFFKKKLLLYRSATDVSSLYLNNDSALKQNDLETSAEICFHRWWHWKNSDYTLLYARFLLFLHAVLA